MTTTPVRVRPSLSVVVCVCLCLCGSAPQALNSYLHTALDNGITFIDIADIYGVRE